ncbi:MAG TPA: helix-turn-helix domain-containing protein [Solirubrobacterales bacterium]|nr:helix-turn-helix domain-containing protein [Solirubrobacterales bacterium]
MGVIGDTLAEARTRRGVDLDEVHAATGIRPRYLRAIEEEDWNALPEEFYARSFVRKYAQFLGVDPEPLVEEYRRQRGTGGSAGAPTSPFARTNSRRADALRRRRKRQAVYVWVGTGILAVAIVVAIVLIASGGGGNETSGKNASSNGGAKAGKRAKGGKGHGARGGGKGGAAGAGAGTAAASTAVVLAIEPTAEVWACVLDAKGRPLVDGATLAPGESVGPFHSRGYTAAFGNGGVEVKIDGKRVATPDTPSPMGFTVDRQGKLHELPEGERPSCE